MTSSVLHQKLQNLYNYLKSTNFTQPLSINLLSVTIDAINGDITGDDLKSILVDKIPSESFVLQEVMACSKFYDKYCLFLKLLWIDMPSVRSTRDMLVVRILISLYGEEVADKTFTVFKENRKCMRPVSYTHLTLPTILLV